MHSLANLSGREASYENPDQSHSLKHTQPEAFVKHTQPLTFLLRTHPTPYVYPTSSSWFSPCNCCGCFTLPKISSTQSGAPALPQRRTARSSSSGPWGGQWPVWSLKKVTVGWTGEKYKQLPTSANKAHSNVFNCACLSENLAHHSSFHFSLRGSPVPENTDVPRKPIPCGGMTLLHTDIFPSVTWHNSVCDLKIQNINKRDEPGPIVLQAEFSDLPSKWKIPLL